MKILRRVFLREGRLSLQVCEAIAIITSLKNYRESRVRVSLGAQSCSTLEATWNILETHQRISNGGGREYDLCLEMIT